MLCSDVRITGLNDIRSLFNSLRMAARVDCMGIRRPKVDCMGVERSIFGGYLEQRWGARRR